MKNPFDTSENVNVDERTRPRTSAEWLRHEDFAHITIVEPTGWDESRLDFSFNEEKITHSEFMKRCMNSICVFKD